jgi:hypothetical protein
MATVEIIVYRLNNPGMGLPRTWHVEAVLDGAQGAFLYRRGDVPENFTVGQAQAWLETNFDEVYAYAVERGKIAPHLIDNPHVDIQRLLKALGLVLRDRDEYIIDHINALADYLGVPQVNRPQPVTPQQVYDAVRDKYIELGQE